MCDAVLIVCLAVVAYVYLGYPAAVILLARIRARPVRKGAISPSVSVVIAARNERDVLARKIQNCLDLAYPQDRLEIVVVSDGSSDDTPGVARGYEGPRMRVITLPEPRGKAAALNVGVAAACGEIVFFTDARQHLARDVAARLVENFADPTVGGVSGELILGAEAGAKESEPIGLYWRYEKLIRRSESALASTVGTTGAIYAIRRHLYEPLPEGTILDDLITPMRIVMKGYRVVFESAARAYDGPPGSLRREFHRKSRTLGGNYQALAIVPGLLSPRRNPAMWQMISHKLGRLVVPYALVAIFLASALGSGLGCTVLFWGQVAAYGAAIAGPYAPPVGGIARAFLVLNAAAVVGLYQFAFVRRIPWNSFTTHKLDGAPS